MRDSVALRLQVEAEVTRLLSLPAPAVLDPATSTAARVLLTVATNTAASQVVTAWRDLLPQLITKYHDGYEATHLTEETIVMKKLFYPLAWLQATGYFLNKPNQGEDVILFATQSGAGLRWGEVLWVVLVTATATLCMAGVVGMMVVRAKRAGSVGGGGYTVIAGDDDLL
jgi:hypothetical protein